MSHEDRHRRPPGHERVGPLEGLLSRSPDPPAGAAGGRRYRLRASVEPFGDASGTLYLVRAGGDDLVIRDPEPADRELVATLAQSDASEPELMTALGLDRSALRSKLRSLEDVGVVVGRDPSPALDPVDAERFSRQLPYLAELGDERELQRRLRRAHVAVLGCGGLGTWTVAALASAGVGTFRLVDDDTVELSNLNRQILYGVADLGRPKVEAAARWLGAFDERIEVAPHRRRVGGADDVRALADGADAVVLAADSPPYTVGRWVNAACVDSGTPFITAGQLPPVIKVGPLYAPGRTACFACHERALRRENPLYDEYVAHVQRSPARGATLGPASGMVGTMLATELLHLLAGREPASWGAALVMDLRTLQVRREPVARDPDCEACHHR